MKTDRTKLIIVVALALIIIAAAGIYAYVIVSNGRVAVDNASVAAPLITLGPSAPGLLQAVYVKEGDTIAANVPVAEVGTQVVTSQVAGLVVAVTDTIGAEINPGQAVVTMIDPTQLRVVGQVDENKGLAQIKVGDPVVFTADAYGSKQFTGVIDEIAPTSNASDVVFSVSNAREEQSFDVKARFDTSAYAELKNGMSARMWVYNE